MKINANTMPDQSVLREDAAIRYSIGKSKHSDWYASKLDAMGPHASPLKKQRFETAVAYLEHYHRNGNKVDRPAVLTHLNAIDFSKPVRLRRLQTGETLRQFQPEAAGMGSCFTDPGVPIHRLGAVAGQGVQQREGRTYQIDKPLIGLESHARPLVDTWSAGRTVRFTRADRQSPTTGKFIKISNRDQYTKRFPGNKQAVDQGLLRTDNPKHGPQIFTTEKSNKHTIRVNQQSGAYVAGGGKQVYVAKPLHARISRRHSKDRSHQLTQRATRQKKHHVRKL